MLNNIAANGQKVESEANSRNTQQSHSQAIAARGFVNANKNIKIFLHRQFTSKNIVKNSMCATVLLSKASYD
jgi:hypothetical protein